MLCRCCQLVNQDTLTKVNNVACCTYCVAEIERGGKMFKTLMKNLSLKVSVAPKTNENCDTCKQYLAPQVDGPSCPDCLQDKTVHERYEEEAEEALDLTLLLDREQDDCRG